MVNPYAVNASRQPQKPQIQLGQSQALKKFEKFQAKYTASASGTSKSKKYNKSSDDDDDDDSLFKEAKQTANKFMKKKPQTPEQDESDDDDSDQTLTESKQSELSIGIDRSSTPVPAKRYSQVTKIPTGNRPSSRIRSAASSVSSIRSLNKRSVKFVKTEHSYSNDDESTIIDDMFSRNLILDIEDLESNNNYKKKSFRRASKSPLAMAAQKRSESVTSIREDDEYEKEISLTESDQSLSIRNNLIMDINELEKSLSKIEEKSHKKDKKKQEHSTKKEKPKKKSSRRRTPSIITDKSTSTIETESITDNDVDDLEPEEIKSTTSEEVTRTKSKHRYSTQRSYNSDFETDLTSAAQFKSRKQLSFAENKYVSTSNAEIQVDPTDLLKNADIMNSINVYNPSSILLATTSHLNQAATLKDLNQLTGYTMINQAFNDLIKMNLGFVSNFLASQRNLYEQQIKSIQPKEYDS